MIRTCASPVSPTPSLLSFLMQQNRTLFLSRIALHGCFEEMVRTGLWQFLLLLSSICQLLCPKSVNADAQHLNVAIVLFWVNQEIRKTGCTVWQPHLTDQEWVFWPKYPYDLSVRITRTKTESLSQLLLSSASTLAWETNPQGGCY